MSVPLARAWERFWFAPDHPRNLAAARILFAAHGLWVLLSRDPASLSALPAAFWTLVLPSTRWRFLVFEGRPGLEGALQWTAVVALVGALLGVWPRRCCLVSALLLYHLAPLETMFFTTSPWVKGYTISTLALATLAFSPCADAWALRRAHSAPPASWDYGWPLRLVQLFLAQVYFFAGYAKLFKTGLSWISVDSVQLYILQYEQNDQLAVFHRVGLFIADRPRLCLAAAVLALVVDFGVIVLVFWRAARPFALPFVAFWHLLVLLSFNIAFLEAWQLLVFVDWDGVARRITRAEGAAR